MSQAVAVTLLLLSSLASSAPFAQAVKATDFKARTCADSAFCTRLRGVPGPAFAIDPASVSVSGAHVAAHLSTPSAPGSTLVLRLISMGPILRLHINELDSSRFEVPSILVPSAGDAQQEWTVVSQDASALRLQTSSGSDVVFSFSPPSLRAFAADGSPVLTWNAEGYFNFEHARQKQEGDPEGWWEESFNSHADSKPHGPSAISFDVLLYGTSNVFGLPERATKFSLAATADSNGTISEPYRLYNLDVFEHLADSPFGLYGSIPYLLGHRPGQTAGVFWLNAAEMYVDVVKKSSGTSTRWVAESGVLDVFFLLGPSPADVARQYHTLTGGTAMPQLFSLGYHQCRWNYKDQADVAAVDAGFEEHAIPYDVLWLDIEHTDGKRYFTWDKTYFPDPIAMQNDVASRGRKMVTIVDPHMKTDPNYRVFKEAQSKGLFVKTKDGQDFKGHCWPGESSYLDVLNPEVREWWADQFATSQYEGSTTNLYIWNDMNEPSVFNGPEITMPKDVRHSQGVEHRDVHNAVGLFYHMATATGLRRRGFKEVDAVSGDRPFVLSRAFFSGTQRVGPIWTGDNSAEWAHLEVSIPTLLALNVAGLPFSGADVGGFFGNPDPELLVRWYQLAAFYPFLRGHAHLETKRREPWVFGEPTTSRIRDAIRYRYRMLPQLYTLFLEANATGAPIMRPLWWEFPEDAPVFEVQSSFMLGDSQLVVPVLHPGVNETVVFLPGMGLWYDGATGKQLDAAMAGYKLFRVPTSLDAPIQTYLRGGTSLVLKERPRRSTQAMARDPVTVILALDRDGTARGTVYIDDGHSFAYQAGAFTYASFSLVQGKLEWGPGDHAAMGLPAPSPTYDPEVHVNRIVVLGLAGGPRGWEAVLQTQEGHLTPLEAGPGPVQVASGLEESALVVRQPHLPARGAWTVLFRPVAATA